MSDQRRTDIEGAAERVSTALLQAKYPKQTGKLVELENREAARHFKARAKARAEEDGRWCALVLVPRRQHKEAAALVGYRYGHAGITDDMQHAHVDVIELGRLKRNALKTGRKIPAPDVIEWNVRDVIGRRCGRCSRETVDWIYQQSRKRKSFKGAAIGLRMRLTAVEREALGIRNILACDEDELARLRRRRKAARGQQAKVRARRRPDTSSRACESCGKPIPDGRVTRRFCDSACRLRRHRQHKAA